MPDFNIEQKDAQTQIGYAEIVHIYGDAGAQHVIAYLSNFIAEYGDLRDCYIDLEGSGAPIPAPAPKDRFKAVRLVTPRLFMESEDAAPVESVQAALDAHRRLVMLGDPGAGKSMSLRVLLATAAERYLAKPNAHPLPLLLNLGAWPKDAATLSAYLEKNLKTPPQGANLLLLLDGLNEMGAEYREQRIDSIRGYLRENSLARVIVTCREKDYDSALDLKLPKLLVTPLDDGRVQKLLAAYLPDKHAALWGAIQPKHKWDTRALLELARNPYLLSILALIYHENGSLPENTAQLFGQMVDYRHSHEEQSQDGAPFDLETLRRALGDLAFEMIDQEKGTSVDRAWAVDLLGGEGDALIRFGEACSLLVDTGSEVRFYHQLMQEYFAALALDRREHELPRLVRQRWTWAVTLQTRAGMGSEARTAVVDAYIAALRDVDEDVRGSAAEALGRIGDARAVEPLIAALGDADADVRWRAAEALGRIGDARAVEALIAALGDANASVRGSAAEALGRIGDARAVEPLIAALGDADEYVRWNAAEALGRIGDARAVKPLIAALGDADEYVRRWLAALALGAIGEPAVEPLIAALSDADVQSGAAEALCQIGKPAVEPLIAALRDVDEDVRGSAAEALGRIGDARAVKPLIAALGDANADVRWRAAEALGRIGEPAVMPLIAALGDADVWVRGGAARALGEIRDTRAVEPLIAALRDIDDVVRLLSAWALAQLGDASGADILWENLQHEYRLVRDSAREALIKLGLNPDNPPPAAKISYWSTFWMKMKICFAVARGLAQLGDASGADILWENLQHEDLWVRNEARRALRILGLDPDNPP